jgi:hypothetical protein
MIYLAQPYTNSPDESYLAALRYVAGALPVVIFSPIIHYHEVARTSDLPVDFRFWSQINHHFLARSSALRVLTLPGWDTSRGVRQEIEWARELNLPVTFTKEI